MELIRSAARVGAVLAVVLLGACGTDDTQDPAATSAPTTPTTPATAGPTASDAPGPSASGPADYPPQVESAVADLAEHLSLPPAEVTVVSYAQVTWPDGSLGCPQPGMSYTQALVPGSRLVLEAEGAEYSYHAGSDEVLTRCDAPRLPVEQQS